MFLVTRFTHSRLVDSMLREKHLPKSLTDLIIDTHHGNKFSLKLFLYKRLEKEAYLIASLPNL